MSDDFYKTAYPNFSGGPIYKHILDLDNPNIIGGESVVGLERVRVMSANYSLLQHDFPQLRDDHLRKEHPGISDLKGVAFVEERISLINKWLIRNAAFISKSQADQTIVNTRIKTDSRAKIAFRPPNYGRALVFPVEKPGYIPEDIDPSEKLGAWGLIDAKGIGVGPGIVPELDSYKHGLLRIDLALREYMMERVLHHIFGYNKTDFSPVPTYAILVPDFKVRIEEGLINTAILLRRAHRREKDGSDLPVYGSIAQMVKIEMELLLRRYGVSSATILIELAKKEGKFRVKYNKKYMNDFDKKQLALIEKVSKFQPPKKIVRGLNIQIAREVGVFPPRAQVLDFGQYSIIRNFKYELLSLTRDRLLRWGGAIQLDDPRYIQPDERISIPFDLWLGEGDTSGKKSKSNFTEDFRQYCSRIGEEFVNYELGGSDVWRAIEDYVYTMVSKWSNPQESK